MDLKKRISILIIYLVVGVTSLYFLWNYINALPPDVVLDHEEINIEDPKVQRINEILSNMDDRGKVAQLFIGDGIVDDQESIIRTYQPGGLLLNKEDYLNDDLDSLSEKITTWQSESNIPMFIATENLEGSDSILAYLKGETVQSSADLYLQGGFDLINSTISSQSKELKEIGFNLELGPVADVAINPYSYIFEQTLKLPIETSLEEAATLTADYVSGVVKAKKNVALGSMLEHFPGYGENDDPTVEPLHDLKDIETFESIDFVPFEAGIEAGAGSILISNNIVEAVDPQKPASLSSLVHLKLRDDLKFSGVIVVNDLDKVDLREYTDEEEPVLLTLNAGTDLIISDNYLEKMDIILEGLENGSLSRERFEEAVYHILSWKYDLGLI